MQGVVKTACLSQRGGQQKAQRQACEGSSAFKRGECVRAGIEGHISVLTRECSVKRCLVEDAKRFASFVGVAVLANNPMTVAPY